jgi:hypothetical protein
MDSFTAALGRLDPASRALLDLSLRRGMKPEEIGELLGTDPESVVAAREAALEQLGRELDMEDPSQIDELRARLAELPSEAWTGTATAAAASRPKLKVVGHEPAEPPHAERRRSRLPLLLALLAIAAIALVVVLASSGGDGNTASKPQANNPAPKPPASKPSKPAEPASSQKPAQPAQNTVRLSTLGSASGVSGTAAVTQGGKRLVIRADGLPPGAYQVWLYNSVIDAVSLTKVEGTKLTLDLKLPANASHYRYVDVSSEPADGNPNHSGESVMRVRLAKLSG